MKEMSKLKFEIDGMSTIIRYEFEGKTQTKIIATSDMPGIFNQRSVHDTGPLGLLGKNVIGVHRVIERGNKVFVFVNGQELIRNITGYQRSFREVKLPGMLMVVALEKEGSSYSVDLYECRIFSYESILYGDNKQLLYFPPFGNVFENSKICWGSVPFEENAGYSKQVAPSLLELFVGSGFNNHIFQNSMPTINGNTPRDSDAVFNHIVTNGANGFPYGDIKMKKKMTYGELISLITNLEGNNK